MGTTQHSFGGWLTANLYAAGTRPVGFTYSPINSPASDTVHTGDRYSAYQTFRGERWRVVILEDDFRAHMRVVENGTEHTGVVRMEDEGANFVGIELNAYRQGFGLFCFDTSGMNDDFRVAINGDKGNGCIDFPKPSNRIPRADRAAYPYGNRKVRLLGSHNDDNLVGPPRTYEISLDHATGKTLSSPGESATVQFHVTDDDVLRLKPLGPKLTGAVGDHTLNIDMRVYGTPASKTFFTIQVALSGPGMTGGSVTWPQTFSPGDSVTARQFNVPLDCTEGDATATFSAIAGSHARHLNPPQVVVLDPIVDLCR